MDLETQGIILNRIEYSDTQQILKIYTKKFGARSFIVSIGKSKSSKSRGSILQPLNQVEIIALKNPRSDLLRIREIRLVMPYQSIPFHISKSVIILFLNEIIHKSIHEPEPDELCYKFISDSLMGFDNQKGQTTLFPLIFLIHFAGFLGFHLSGRHSEQTPVFDLQMGSFVKEKSIQAAIVEGSEAQELSQLMETPINGPFPAIQHSRPLLHALVHFFMIHNPQIREIKSLAIIRDLLD